jgi:DNA sulfur modification protein DndD
MRLAKIELENYKPFKGPGHEINFTPNDGKNIILVRGKNGAGKTSFFSAVNFVFYGEPTGREGWSVNASAAGEGDGWTTVRVFFEHGGINYEVRRSIEFKKTPMITKNSAGDPEYSSGATIISKEFSVSVDNKEMQWPGTARELEEEQRKFIEGILPEEASKFYLFDGEKIKDYTAHDDSATGSGNQERIGKIIGLAAMDNTVTDLKARRSTYERQVRLSKSASQPIRQMQEEAEKENTKYQEARNALKDLNEKKTTAETNLEATERLLQERGKILIWLQDREAAEGKKSDAIKTLNNLKMTSAEFNSEKFPTMIILELLQKINAKKQIGESSIKSSQIDDAQKSLEASKCVLCTQNLDKNATAILQKLTKSDLDELHDFQEVQNKFVLSSNYALPSIEKELKDINSGFAIQRLILKNADDDIEKYDKLIPADAARGSKEDAQRGERRNELIKEISELEGQIKLMHTTSQGHKERYDEYMDQIDKDTKDQTQKEFSGYSKTAAKFIKAFEKLKENVIARQKEEIEHLGTVIWQQLTTKPKHFVGIKLDSKMQLMVNVKQDDGSEIPMYPERVWVELSSGERNVLALAFVEALTTFADMGANAERPVFIDTPFGRLDEDLTWNISKYLAGKNKQLIILYQPDEIENKNAQSFNEILRHTAHHYEITSIQNGGISNIKEMSM